MKKNFFLYALVVVFSLVILVFWSRYSSDGAGIFKEDTKTLSGKIVSVDSKKSEETQNFTTRIIICSVKITSGNEKGKVVKACQEHNSAMQSMKIVEEGDRVIIKNYPFEDIGTQWVVDSYYRTPSLLWLGLGFLILIIIFGGLKGIRTVISLLYTCIAVFAVFIPSVLSGKNIYLCSVLVCIYIITTTLLLVNGFDKKTFCASLGCIGGVIAAAIITLIFSKLMKFTGYTDEHSYYLTMLEHPVNLGAIYFSSVIIGAVGAVMDVAMSMSSSLYELSVKASGISAKSLVSSGLSIGRDMMGTMANTLVLAYVGSSLSSVLLLLTYAGSLTDIINREIISSEILQAVSGSVGIILAIPITALVCGFLYKKS